jgi:hypothetical protein
MTAPRRRWSFSLRTLFVVVTALGGSLGWVTYQFNWIRERHRVLADLPRGVVVTVSDPLADNADNPNIPYTKPPTALRLFGEMGVVCFEYCPRKRQVPAELVSLFPEAQHYDIGSVPRQSRSR